jgi:hypothetical protein
MIIQQSLLIPKSLKHPHQEILANPYQSNNPSTLKVIRKKFCSPRFLNLRKIYSGFKMHECTIVLNLPFVLS